MTALLKKVPEWSPRLLQATDDTPEVGWVSIAELHYDWLHWVDGQPVGYQRPLDPGWVAKHLSVYDPGLVHLVTLSRRADGSLWVIDGQHRIALLAALGKQVVLAAISSGLTREQESARYERLNSDRKQPNQWNRFGARGSSRDPKTLALIALTAECGFKIGTADRSLGSIAAVNMLSRVYEWSNGPALLRFVLRKVSEIWPTDIGARDGVFIEGLALLVWNWDGGYLLREGNAIDWRRFDTIFSKVRATEITRRCKELKIEAGFAMNASTYATAFRDIYNGKANFTGRLNGRVLTPTARGARAIKDPTVNHVRGRR